MADNTPLNAGTGGNTIRTDEIAAVHYPTSKITIGADGFDDGFVSAANPLPVSGAFYPATQPVSGTFWQATQPVSGTFWQATQPVSATSLPLPTGAATEATLTAQSAKFPAALTAGGNFKVALAESAVPQAVTGTFWQATQPVSGTFWQATQPVSGTVTANIGTAGTLALDATLTGGTAKAIARGGAKGTATAADVTSTNVDANTQALDVSVKGTAAVTGTFWQATQPVSGTVTANIGTAGTLALDATLTGGTAKAIARGGAKGTTAAADLTSTAQGANNQALDVQIYHGAAAVNPQTIRALTAADIVTVTPPTLTKGAQGATGFSVQNLKDAGRTLFVATCTAIAGVTAEALLTMTPYRGTTAGAAATTFAVTANKTLRLQQIVVTWRNNTAAAGGVTIRLRVLAGTVLVGSPVYLTVNASTALATVGSGYTMAIDIPDGFELSGTQQFGCTQIAVGAVAGVDVQVIGFEY